MCAILHNNSRILARSLANFYCQEADRRRQTHEIYKKSKNWKTMRDTIKTGKKVMENSLMRH